MRKKLFAILMSTLMMVSFMPSMAFATVTEGHEAKIGDTSYSTLAEAVSVAQTGQTIEIIKAGEYSVPTPLTSVTVKGAVDGVIFNAAGSGSIAAAVNVKFQNITFNMGNAAYHGFQHNGGIRFEECVFNGLFNSYGTEYYYKCTFNQTAKEYCMWVYGGNSITYDTCTFNTCGKVLNVYNEGNGHHNLAVKDCTFKNESNPVYKPAVLIKSKCGDAELEYDVTISGNNTLVGNWPSETSVYNDGNMKTNGLWDVEGDGTKINVTVGSQKVYPVSENPEIIKNDFVKLQVKENTEKGITNEIVEQVSNNTAVTNFVATNLSKAYTGEGSGNFTVQFTLEEAVAPTDKNEAKLKFEVVPTLNDAAISNDKINGKVTFRLPLTANFNDVKVVKVIHHAQLGDKEAYYEVQGEANAKYVEITTPSFSEFDVLGTNLNRVPVAQIGETKYETLADAIAAAKSGEAIKLLVDLENIGAVSLPAGVTLDGDNHKITGASGVYIHAVGATVQNIKFENIHNNTPVSNADIKTYGWTEGKTGTQSAIYSEGLTGTAVITGCSFDSVDWDAIQVSGKVDDNAKIIITNNEFKHTEENSTQIRYIHIQPSGIGSDVDVKINGNKFYKTKNTSDTAITTIGIWNVDDDGLQLTGNYFEYTGDVVYTDATISQGLYGNDCEGLFPAIDNEGHSLKYVTLAGNVAYLNEATAPGIKGDKGVYLTFDEAITAEDTDVELLRDVAANNVVIPEGVTLEIDSDVYALTGSFINNGTLNLWYGDGDCNVTVTNNGTIIMDCDAAAGYTVSGGIVKISDGEVYNLSKITNSDICISGGTFTTKPAETLIEDFYIVEEDGGNYTVRKMTKEEAAEIAVAYEGTEYSPTYLKTLETNKAARTYLLKDVENGKAIWVDSSYNYGGLDTNGHSFTGSINMGTKNYVILYGDNLVLTDVIGKKLQLGPWNEAAKVTIQNGTLPELIVQSLSKCTIEGGKYDNITVYTRYENKDATEPYQVGELTIKGGLFKSNEITRTLQNHTPASETAALSSYVEDDYEVIALTDSDAGYADGYRYKVQEKAKVAQVGTNKYTSLEDAIKAAETGETVTLLADCTTSKAILVDKSIALDLGTYKVTPSDWQFVSGNGNAMISVKRGAVLTINGTTGSISTGDQEISGLSAAIGITVKSEESGEQTASVIVNGGTIEGYYYGITGNGNRHNTEININGGTIKGLCESNNLAIFHPQSGKLTISGGTLEGYSSAVEMRAGELNVSGGTFKATAPEYKCKSNGSGNTTEGAAIAIAQHNTKKDIKVNISGGTFTGVKALSESNPQANDPAPQVTMRVTGGTFDGDVSVADAQDFIKKGSFTDLAGAIKYATDGATIKLLKDVTGGGIQIDTSKYATTGLTIDFNDHTYTCTGNAVGSTGTENQVFQLLQGGKITMKNGKIQVASDKGELFRFIIQNYADLELNGMELDGTSLLWEKSHNEKNPYTLSNNCGKVEIIKTKIIAAENQVGLDTCKYGSYDTPEVNIQEGSDVGIIELSGGNLNLKGGKVVSLKDAGIGAGVITKINDFTIAAPAGYKWVDNDTNTDQLVSTSAVAKIGTKTYTSIADAIEAATTGDTVKLLKDTNGAADVKGNKTIILDLNEKTLTLGPAIGSTGTETSGIRVFSGNTLTVKNGNLVCSDMKNDKGKYVRVGFANYGTLTLDDIIMTTSDGATLWTINNRGNLTLTGNTTIPQATRTETTGNVGCTCAAINMTPYDYANFDNAVLNVADSKVNVADIVINDENDPNHATQQVELNISAGTFGKVTKIRDYTNVSIVGNITGGTFSADPSAYVASRYSVYKKANPVVYVVSNIAPAHSAGMNTWTLNAQTGLYEESYVAPPTPVTPADDTIIPEKIEEATSIDVSKDVEVKKDESGVVAAKTEISEKLAEELVKAVTENKSTEVVIAATATTTETVDKAEVALTVKAIAELAKVDTVQTIVIQTNVAEIALDKKTAEEVAKQAPEGATIIVEAVREDEKSKEVAQDVYELKIIAVQSGTKTEIGDFKGGKVTVKVDIPEGLTGKKVACLYRDDNGWYTRRTITNQDDVNGFFSFTTEHFSDYIVTEESTAQKMLVNQTAENQKKLKSYANGKIKVSFDKVTYDTELGKKVQTYQIYRSTKKNSGFKKVGTVVNKKKSTKTITYTNAKKLKKGKKYYYKVRGRVKLANGKYSYTQWSNVRYAKCKKSR